MRLLNNREAITLVPSSNGVRRSLSASVIYDNDFESGADCLIIERSQAAFKGLPVVMNRNDDAELQRCIFRYRFAEHAVICRNANPRHNAGLGVEFASLNPAAERRFPNI